MSKKSLITSFSIGVCLFISISIILTVFILRSFLEYFIQLLNAF